MWGRDYLLEDTFEGGCLVGNMREETIGEEEG